MELEKNIQFIDCMKITRMYSEYKTIPRNFSVISCRISGSSTFFFENESVIANTKNVLFIPEKTPYRQSGGKEELIAIHFRGNIINSSTITAICPEDMPLVKNLFISLYNVCCEHNPGNKYKAYSIFYDILHHIASEKDENNNIVISPSINYIDKNYKNPDLNISEIAKESSVSEVYFRKIFKKIYGKTPVKYINEQRISYACSLLQGNYLSLEETAAESGFNNVKYFSKVFSEIVGTTPGKYRKYGK